FQLRLAPPVLALQCKRQREIPSRTIDLRPLGRLTPPGSWIKPAGEGAEQWQVPGQLPSCWTSSDCRVTVRFRLNQQSNPATLWVPVCILLPWLRRSGSRNQKRFPLDGTINLASLFFTD